MTTKRKATEAKGPNSDICEFLHELAIYEKNVNRNIHKFKVYSTAASMLAQHSERIKNGKEAQKLKGIGKKIGEKIDEFLLTGKVEKLEKIRKDDTSQAINILTKVVGIGPVAAQKFVEKGIMTIEDLKKNADKLTHQQKIGLKYFDDFEKKIPRAEMEEFEKTIVSICHGIDKKYIVTICGSYRRGASESGDIDILLTHPAYFSNHPKQPHLLMQVVSKLEKQGIITDTLSVGEAKYMGVCHLKEGYPFRRIDIGVFPHDQYYCGTLYFTGSGLFNQQMRQHALKHNFTLSEFSIRPIGSTGTPGEPLRVASERDIFDYIDYPYKEPHERNDVQCMLKDASS